VTRRLPDQPHRGAAALERLRGPTRRHPTRSRRL